MFYTSNLQQNPIRGESGARCAIRRSAAPAVFQLHLQPGVPDEGGLACRLAAKTARAPPGHENEEQVPVKLIAAADVEGGRTLCTSHADVIINLSQGFEFRELVSDG